jgi:hypothetical protein
MDAIFQLLDQVPTSDPHEPFQIPVHKMYPSSMSIMIHWPRRGYSYTGLPPCQRASLATALDITYM